jgi:hypothetical protein
MFKHLYFWAYSYYRNKTVIWMLILLFSAISFKTIGLGHKEYTMDYDMDDEIPIKFPSEKDIILNKEMRVVDFINKTVQISYNLN